MLVPMYVPLSHTYYRVEQLQEIHNWPICCWHIWFVKELLWLVLWLVVIALLWLVHPVLWPVHPVLWLAIIALLCLVPRSLLPEERPGTHCLRMRKIFHYLFRKKLCALPCPYVEDYTNQEYRAFFELDSSDDLTCRTPLGYYFSDVAVSFFQNVQSNRKVTNRFTKKACW